MLHCPRSPRSNVTPKYESARRFFGRLACEDFLSSLQSKFFITLLVMAQRLNPESSSMCDVVCQLSRNLLQPPQRSKRFPTAWVLLMQACHAMTCRKEHSIKRSLTASLAHCQAYSGCLTAGWRQAANRG